GREGLEGGEPAAPAVDPQEHAAIRRLRARRSLDPEVPPAPPWGPQGRSRLATFGRLCGIVFAAAIIALIVVGQIPFPDILRQRAADRGIELASSSSRPAASATKNQSDPIIPRLVVQDARGN